MAMRAWALANELYPIVSLLFLYSAGRLARLALRLVDEVLRLDAPLEGGKGLRLGPRSLRECITRGSE